MSATLLFGLVFSAFASVGARERTRNAVLAAAGVAASTITGGLLLERAHLPTLSIKAIVTVSLLFALVVGVALRWAHSSPTALSLLVIVTSLFVIAVNPVQVGLADLRNGEAAGQVRNIAKSQPDGRWATDTPASDALLMANGAGSLGGQQWVGPEEFAWRILDPPGRFRSSWNRGASYVIFQWAKPDSTIRISRLQQDMVRVDVDPCDESLHELGLRFVMSITKLDRPCLTLRTRFTWGGNPRWVYAVSWPDAKIPVFNGGDSPRR